MGAGTRGTSFRARGPEVRRERIQILDNPLGAVDPGLARNVEKVVHQLIQREDVGPVEVRFRVCRDEGASIRFICRVENPPWEGEGGPVQWRWWSPLMETADDFRHALEEGLRVRRDRLAGEGRTASA
jgi:hypothetical protein